MRTGTLRVAVDAYESSRQELEAVVTGAGGFVGSSRIGHGERGAIYAELVLRIPVDRFDQVVHRVEQLGKVLDESTDAQDVTDAWVDLEARLKNARQMEGRLLEIVARGEKVSDLLEVERELGRVREEIERAEGRLRYLRSRVALATLTVTVHEPPPIVGGSPSASPIAEAFRQAWRNFVAAIAWAIAMTGVVLPAGVLAFGAWLGWRAWRRRTRTAAV